ncbi:hypothetical protein [Streptomyces boninensis]|uniref:hypothetical protein n=1 Tax=Streptomyces boninensis TaxID=2039455 RepID=UPI003B217720
MTIDPTVPLGRTVEVEGKTLDLVTHTELRFHPSGMTLLIIFHDDTEIAAVALSSDETTSLGAAFINSTSREVQTP